MSYKKPDPERVLYYEKRIRDLKAEIQEVQELASLVDSSGWKKLKGIVTRKLGMIEGDLDRFERLDEREVNCLLGARVNCKYFLSLVDGSEAAINQLTKSLMESEKSLKDLLERIV